MEQLFSNKIMREQKYHLMLAYSHTQLQTSTPKPIMYGIKLYRMK